MKINSNVKAYLLSNSFYYGAFDIINAFLAILVTSNIANNRLDVVGFVISYYLLLRTILEIPLTKLTSHYSVDMKIHIVSGGYLLYGICVILMGFSTQLWHVFVLQTMLAIFDALVYPLKWGIFSKIIDKDNEEMEWGMEDVLSTAMTAIFAALGGVISDKFGLEVLFIIFGVLFSLGGISFHLIKVKKHSSKLHPRG